MVGHHLIGLYGIQISFYPLLLQFQAVFQGLLHQLLYPLKTTLLRHLEQGCRIGSLHSSPNHRSQEIYHRAFRLILGPFLFLLRIQPCVFLLFLSLFPWLLGLAIHPLAPVMIRKLFHLEEVVQSLDT